MTTTRDFKSLGVWAETAETVIPVAPIYGQAYRDETTSEVVNEAGEDFNTYPNSAEFNQKLFIISSFTDLMDKHGIVGWSEQVDYDVPALVFGSDFKFYLALQASGPSTATQDPISAPTYWEEFITKSLLAQTTGASFIGTPAGVNFPVSTFTPHAWAAHVDPSGVSASGANHGIASISHPSDGRYVITLVSPLSPTGNRFIIVTPLTNGSGGEDPPIIGTNIGDAAVDDTTIVVETFDDQGNLEDPPNGAGFSIMVYIFN